MDGTECFGADRDGFYIQVSSMYRQAWHNTMKSCKVTLGRYERFLVGERSGGVKSGCPLRTIVNLIGLVSDMMDVQSGEDFEKALQIMQANRAWRSVNILQWHHGGPLFVRTFF
ncbi:hypothetical protein PM082_024639 [Marasmius tenuissimus]|nr:hypothetical protein PM082_024639 [Marasmius tenuissimus]